jgi:hypothetical protein
MNNWEWWGVETEEISVKKTNGETEKQREVNGRGEGSTKAES